MSREFDLRKKRFRVHNPVNIEEYEIGEFIGGGGTVDGNHIDVTFDTDDLEKAKDFRPRCLPTALEHILFFSSV